MTAPYSLERSRDLRAEMCTGFGDKEGNYDLGESAPNGWRRRHISGLGMTRSQDTKGRRLFPVAGGCREQM